MKKKPKIESHKYLNELGISSEVSWIFNTKEVWDKKKTQKHFINQREKYGFDERETWALNSTLIGWLYSHLKWYVKHSPVDFAFNSFDVPVLTPIPRKKLEWTNEGKIVAVRYYTESIKHMTQEEAMNTALSYMEYYLKHEDDRTLEKESKSIEKACCALKIIAEIFPALWW